MYGRDNLQCFRLDYCTNFISLLGKVEEALNHARHCVLLDPLSAQANHLLAWALWLARDDEKSIEYDIRTLELAPDFVYAHLTYGSVLMELGQLDETLEVFQPFLERFPNASLIRAALIDDYMYLDDQEHALNHLRILLHGSNEPDHATRQSLVHAYSALRV